MTWSSTRWIARAGRSAGPDWAATCCVVLLVNNGATPRQRLGNHGCRRTTKANPHWWAEGHGKGSVRRSCFRCPGLGSQDHHRSLLLTARPSKSTTSASCRRGAENGSQEVGQTNDADEESRQRSGREDGGRWRHQMSSVAGRSFHVTTFGCQMNEYDSEVISASLESLGCFPVESSNGADIIVFNTCCVRGECFDAESRPAWAGGRIPPQSPNMVVSGPAAWPRKMPRRYANAFPT